MKGVERNPEVLWGTPVFAGTRVPVAALFDYLARGAGVDAFASDFPSVARDQINQVLRASTNRQKPS
jgi:uncharacterized protein (DUF433 family)